METKGHATSSFDFGDWPIDTVKDAAKLMTEAALMAVEDAGVPSEDRWDISVDISPETNFGFFRAADTGKNPIKIDPKRREEAFIAAMGMREDMFRKSEEMERNNAILRRKRDLKKKKRKEEKKK